MTIEMNLWQVTSFEANLTPLTTPIEFRIQLTGEDLTGTRCTYGVDSMLDDTESTIVGLSQTNCAFEMPSMPWRLQ